jgi:hypothetical protein
MNCVLLKKEIDEGLRIWAVLSHAMDDLNAARNAGQNRAALGYDLLQYSEKLYFSRLPFGHVRRVLALKHHVWLNASYKATVPLRLRLRKMFGQPPKRPPVLVTKSLGS